MNTEELLIKLKAEAKLLRLKLGKEKVSSHGHALEILSAMYGFKDWNTMSAIAKNEPEREEFKKDIGILASDMEGK